MNVRGRRPRPGRPGYTLVEMLMVMFVFTAFLGVSVALVELLLKMDGGARAHQEAIAATARLARAFRADVHAASRVGPPAGAPAPSDRLVLAGPGGRAVEYRVERGSLVRTEREDGVFRRTESFPLPARTGRLAIEEDGGRTRVAVVFDRRSARNRGAPRELRLEAALGLDHRFARPGGGRND